MAADPNQHEESPAGRRDFRSCQLDTEKLNNLRLVKAWTLEQLARKAGVSTRLVDKAVAGDRVSLSKIQDLATALGVKPTEIMLLDDGKMGGQIVLNDASKNILDGLTVKLSSRMSKHPELALLLVSLIEKIIDSLDGIELILVREGNSVILICKFLAEM